MDDKSQIHYDIAELLEKIAHLNIKLASVTKIHPVELDLLRTYLNQLNRLADGLPVIQLPKPTFAPPKPVEEQPTLLPLSPEAKQVEPTREETKKEEAPTEEEIHWQTDSVKEEDASIASWSFKEENQPEETETLPEEEDLQTEAADVEERDEYFTPTFDTAPADTEAYYPQATEEEPDTIPEGVEEPVEEPVEESYTPQFSGPEPETAPNAEDWPAEEIAEEQPKAEAPKPQDPEMAHEEQPMVNWERPTAWEAPTQTPLVEEPMPEPTHQEPEPSPQNEPKLSLEETPEIKDSFPLASEVKTERPEPVSKPEEPAQPSKQETHWPADNQSPAEQKRSLNDLFSRDSNQDLGSRFQFQNRRNLREMIDLSERYIFTKELFGGDADYYDRAIRQLNQFETLAEAQTYIANDLRPKYNWEAKEQVEKQFIKIVERRFA